MKFKLSLWFALALCPGALAQFPNGNVLPGPSPLPRITVVHNGVQDTTFAYSDLGTVISNRVGGDWLFLGPTQFDVTNPITIPAGVSMVGQGNATIINNWADLSNGVCISLSSNVYIGYLQITNALSAWEYQGCIGSKNNQNATQPPFDAITDHLVCWGDSDSWYLNNTNSVHWTDFGSYFHSKWDAAATQSAGGNTTHYYDLFGTIFNSVGPSVFSPGASARCIVSSSGVTLNLNAVGCSLITSGGFSGHNFPLDLISGSAAHVDLENCFVKGAAYTMAAAGTFLTQNTTLPADLNAIAGDFPNGVFPTGAPQSLSTEIIDFLGGGVSLHDQGVGDSTGTTNWFVLMNTNGLTCSGPLASTGTNAWAAPTNSTGTTVKGQLPVKVNGVTYWIDLKR